MTVDEYLASRPDVVQPALVLVRAAIRKALPADCAGNELSGA